MDRCQEARRVQPRLQAQRLQRALRRDHRTHPLHAGAQAEGQVDEGERTPDKRIDLNWFHKHLLDHILPHWLSSSVTDSGMFAPRLGSAWQPQAEQVATLVSQCRLLYCFTKGHQLTGEEPYRAAVANGAQWQVDHLRDREHAGWFFSCAPDGTSGQQSNGWWEQCEAIRALMHFGIVRDRDDVWEPLQRTVDFAKRKFADAEPGGWYSGSWTPKAGITNHSKGSEWKVDYHVVGMCVEALRLQETASLRS